MSFNLNNHIFILKLKLKVNEIRPRPPLFVMKINYIRYRQRYGQRKLHLFYFLGQRICEEDSKNFLIFFSSLLLCFY